MADLLTVIIPTFNPDRRTLAQTIAGLKAQTLPFDEWELILVDNNSNDDFYHELELEWQSNHQLIREKRQGLTFARICGFQAARGELIVLVDDDNILDPDYLKLTREIFDSRPEMGAIGGKSIPRFQEPAPGWLTEFYGNLALRDLGEEVIIDTWNHAYPLAAPVGAGLALRRSALGSYLLKITDGGTRIPDRQGGNLSSGGDNDIVLEVLKSGWQTGYFPQLRLQHIIPGDRMRSPYLARLIHQTNRSWVAVLEHHQINPWKRIAPWTVPFRKIKAWLTYAAWRSQANYIRWRGACGLFDGLAERY